MYSRKYNKVILDDEDEEEGSTINTINTENNLFHYLTGEYDYIEKDDKFSFTIFNGNKQLFDECVLLYDPGYDTTFKELFLNHPKRLENFLNNIYFLYNNMKLENLEFLVGDYYDFGKVHGFNSLSSDISCKASIKKNKTILLDAEIQIGWRNRLDDRLFEYGSLLRNRFTNQERERIKEIKNKKWNSNNNQIERYYNNTIVIAFILEENLKNDDLTCKIELIKTKNCEKKQEIMNNFKIFEIHLYYEVEKIIKGQSITLFGNTLNQDGQDWLKLIGLRCWAPKSKGKLRYLLPKLKDNERYSQNNYINEAIGCLIKGNDVIRDIYDGIDEVLIENAKAIEEIVEKRGLENGKKISEIKCIYSFFINGKNPLEFIKLEYKYTKADIIKIFENYLKEIKIEENLISDFIEYLNKNGYIIN